ncbi:hypothetical protein Tco_1158298 [Tanacetum coccineum]
MGDENPIRTLVDYSRPSHEGYQKTIELPDGNNVVPLRSNTIWMVQNRCSFHGLWSEDPNQHLKDFLKLVDSLDLDVENRERTHLRESLSEAWTRFKDLLQKVPHHGIDIWLQVQIFYDHVNPATRRTIDHSANGKLRDRNGEESWALLEDLTLYDIKTDFKEQQGEMTNKIDIVLKGINDRITGALPSEMVKNPKLNVNSTSPFLSAPKQAIFKKYQLQTINEIGTSKPKEPTKALDDKFKDFHLKLPVLEVLAHAPMYNAILDKYVESLELGKNGSAFIQGKTLEKIKDPGLFTLPCMLETRKVSVTSKVVIVLARS